jgi:hypothetical protein
MELVETGSRSAAIVRIRKHTTSHPANIALTRTTFCALVNINFVLFLAAHVSGPFVGRCNFHAGLKPDYTGGLTNAGFLGLPLLSIKQLACYKNLPELAALFLANSLEPKPRPG